MLKSRAIPKATTKTKPKSQTFAKFPTSRNETAMPTKTKAAAAKMATPASSEIKRASAGRWSSMSGYSWIR
jgi:hypothetical protein